MFYEKSFGDAEGSEFVISTIRVFIVKLHVIEYGRACR